MAAAELLSADWQVDSEVWSVTSFTELARDARGVERWNRHHPEGDQKTSHVAECLPKGTPIIGATDYVRALAQLIGSYVEDHYVVLGTDGFGRSDTRAALRKFFEVDRHQIVLSALWALVHEGKLSAEICSRAIEKYDIGFDETAPWEC